MDKIRWEEDVPLVVAEFLRRHRKDSSQITFEELKASRVGVVTPLPRLREIARAYSRRYKIPVRISERAFADLPHADACYKYGGGKAIVYLHPLLTYYPEAYIQGAIEHELDHARVEERWEGIL